MRKLLGGLIVAVMLVASSAFALPSLASAATPTPVLIVAEMRTSPMYNATIIWEYNPNLSGGVDVYRAKKGSDSYEWVRSVNAPGNVLHDSDGRLGDTYYLVAYDLNSNYSARSMPMTVVNATSKDGPTAKRRLTVDQQIQIQNAGRGSAQHAGDIKVHPVDGMDYWEPTSGIGKGFKDILERQRDGWMEEQDRQNAEARKERERFERAQRNKNRSSTQDEKTDKQDTHTDRTSEPGGMGGV